MQVANRNQKSLSVLEGFLLWVKANLPMVIMVVVGAMATPFLYRYFKSQIQNNKEQDEDIKAEQQLIENKNPATAQQNANKITLDKGVQASAQQLAVDLGVKYSDAGNWWDFLNPRGWTENDAAVLRTLKYQVRNIHLVEKLYFEVYTKRRNLKDDVNKLLDSKELAELKEYYKKYGKVW
ncbi:hypothetical protein SAMN05192550_2814 [Flavobacterium glycines]|uniref:Uncharacterized protein n=2 Tax=Flavobacterium glycines TaxID=551990 RepID=A0A1B9DSN1_9FLAO|nr:hypothetical protein [Flavobacterium glycines]OCB72711.1 hypothetical protein FBGL_05145 [Flavobacterium glycines]SDJ80872.1 hypothetical protein SAMN05192550_2814 [Flavobacterium glycines]